LTADLAVGLIVASAVPCTLASAAVWTRLAGGNDSVSLLVTMFTNLSCFVVTPAIIYLLAGKSGVEIEFSEMALKLLLLIVLPIVAAQLLRLIAPVGRWAAANKQLLSTYAQLGILSIVLVGAVRCGERIAALEGELSGVAGQVLLMLVLVAAIHLVAWWAGLRTAAALGMARADQLAVAFAGSQKTLMVGLAIALEFGGLAALPMLAYHVEQLLVDTVLAGRARNGAESITP
jgi:sodium/bile acid cotransporter 7